MMKSVSTPPLDPSAVSGTTIGRIDMLDYVDAVQGLFPRIGPMRIPHGAPVLASGWAVDPTCDLPPAAVAVVLDGLTVHSAETGLSRYDVKALLGEQTPEMIGFRVVVPTKDMTPGEHSISAFVLAADGLWYEAEGRSFQLYGRMLPELAIERRRMRIEIDAVYAVAPNGERGGVAGVVPHGQFALITGWAADRDGMNAPAGVCATDAIEGRWTVSCDLPRPDVRAALGGASDRFGFEIAVPTDGLARGEQTVELWAFDASGRRLGQPVEVSFEVGMAQRLFPAFAEPLDASARAQVLATVRGPSADDEPRMLRADREIVVVRGDVLEIEGWAVLPDDEPGAQLVLEMHPLGIPVPPSRYDPVAGYHRDDPPRAFDMPPRDDVWFSYRLGTMLLSPFRYRFTLAVVADGGYHFARAELGTITVRDGELEASLRGERV